MAEVFLARAEGAEGFTRRVALKRVLPGLSENTGVARMFISEARLSSRLQHQNIVSVLDFDRDHHSRLFLVMELVDGVGLDVLLGTGPLSIPLSIFLAVEALSGLRYAHDLPVPAEDGIRGIVHRDLSPHNVLLSWEGGVKISDFGIAKGRATSNVTASGVVKGKPRYLSPEQANGQPLDGRSDLFAVGVMLWEMLCLRPLFSGATAQETISRMLFAPIASPSAIRREVSEDLSRAVLRLLARDRAQRTPNAEAAIAELVACADHPRNGREVLIQTLAERFADRAATRARDVVRDAAAVPAQVGARRPAPPLAPGELPTLTQVPGAVVDPVAPPIRRRRARRRPTWIVAASFATIGSLAGGGLSFLVGDPLPVFRAIGAGSSSTPAPRETPGAPAERLPAPGQITLVVPDAPAATACLARATGADGSGADESCPTPDAAQPESRDR